MWLLKSLVFKLFFHVKEYVHLKIVGLHGETYQIVKIQNDNYTVEHYEGSYTHKIIVTKDKLIKL